MTREKRMPKPMFVKKRTVKRHGARRGIHTRVYTTRTRAWYGLR